MKQTINRYHKQILLPEIALSGQEKLQQSRVLVAGCGALGTVIANTLVRSGVGTVVIIDRDYIEVDNLVRQILFDEVDVANNLPKAIAAARKLALINSQIKIIPLVEEMSAQNIEDLIMDVDIVLDGLDNFETRFLINEACCKHQIPWIYGGVLSTYGMSFTIIPYQTACLSCFVDNQADLHHLGTCDTMGVLSTVVSMVASIEATEAIKYLIGRREAMETRLTYLDVWNNTNYKTKITKKTNCPVCGLKNFDLLKLNNTIQTTYLCGKDAYQIKPATESNIDFEQLSHKLEHQGKITYNNHLFKMETPSATMTLFPGGRAIIKGVSEKIQAEKLYKKYFGEQIK